MRRRKVKNFNKSVRAERYLFYNPIDTRNILYNIIEHGGNFEKNINLLFSRLIPIFTDGAGKSKDEHLNFVVREFERFKSKIPIFSLLNSRRENLIKSMEKAGFVFRIFNASSRWRLIIGLGATHPEETSMTLHHIYGVPYIPGSAVKGVTKHWAVLKFADSSNNKGVNEISAALEEGRDLNIEIEGIKFSELIRIFGTQKKAGEVIFMDAYPLREDAISLKIDIMNPHYPKYYSEKQPPADWQNPVPIKFLTVEKTNFQFCLISKDNSLLQKSEMLLKEALKNSGVGAKTSLGYGIFDLV